MNPLCCETLASILNVQKMELKEKYLGLPLFIGRNKRIPFSVLAEKMEEILTKWSGTNLSQVERTVMVKNVLNIIHILSYDLF